MPVTTALNESATILPFARRDDAKPSHDASHHFDIEWEDDDEIGLDSERESELRVRLIEALENGHPNAAQRVALKYAGRGFYPIPVHGIVKAKRSNLPECSCQNGKQFRADKNRKPVETCGSPGKHPTVEGWERDNASRDPDDILHLFSPKWNNGRDGVNAGLNIGFVTGPDTGLVVLDIDGKEGFANLIALIEQHGPLGQTIQVQTGSGGRHYYFRAPDGVSIPNSASKIAPKVDFRGQHGFVVAPPSKHIKGRSYAWEPGCSPDELPLGEMPEWLIKLALEGGDEEGAPRAKAKASGRDRVKNERGDRQSSAGNGEGGWRQYLAEVGDHESGKGFSGPIWNALLSYFRVNGHDADETEIVEALEETVRTADRSAKDNRDRYLPDSFHMVEQIEKARQTIMESPERVTGFDALVNQAIAEKAKDGVISAATKDALTDCCAIGRAPSNAFEVLKSKLGIGTTQFQKDVSSRQRKIAADTGFDPDNIVSAIKKKPAFAREIRPIVPIHPDQEVRSLRFMLAELEKANIGDANTSPGHVLFDFGGQSVRVEKTRNGKRRIDSLSESVFVNAVTDLLCIVRVERDGGASEVFLDSAIAKQAIVDPKLPLLPLARFVKHPLFTKDGGLLLRSGYDPETTCCIDLDGLDLSTIDLTSQVTKKDVQSALAALDHAFGDFRWASCSDDEGSTGAGSRAAFYALLLTPLVWELVSGPVPLFGISKPDPGAGGTLLMECAHVLWTGEQAALESWPTGSDDTELNKKIVGLLLAGRGAIIFDNVHGKVESSALPKLITGKVSERLLGTNKMFEGGVHYPVVLIGNGLSFSDENARRTIPICIRPNVVKTDKAGTKQFKIANLVEHLTDKRSEYMSHLITIVRWWLQQPDRPKAARSIDSFEEYSSTMGGILQAAGIDGWLDGRVGFITEHQRDRSDDVGILTALATRFGSGEFTSANAKDVLFSQDDDGPSWAPFETRFDRLSWCIKNGLVSADNLGKALGYLKGQERTITIDGKAQKVELKRRRSDGANYWRVTPVAV